jgi:two-component system, sensor histidine kinase ChiS
MHPAAQEPLHRALSLLSAMLAISILSSCSPSRVPLAKDGVLDLRDWNFAEEAGVPLRGEWAFSYDPVDVGQARGGDGSFISVPSTWTGARTGGAKAGPFGAARYDLLVRLPALGKFSIRMGDVGTAYELYANGMPVGGRGILSAIPDARAAYFDIEAPSPELRLELLVSNFEDSHGGGIWDVPILGSPRAIEGARIRDSAIEAFISGILFGIAVFFLAIRLFRRGDRTLLLFTLICLGFMIRQLDTGERLMRLALPGLGWRGAFRIEYLSAFCQVPLYLFLFYKLFPEDFDRRVMLVLVALGCASAVAIVALPIPAFTALLLPIQLYSLACAAAAFLLLARAARKGSEDARFFLASLGVLVLAVANDIALVDLSAPTIALIPFGQAGFILIQAVALSRRVARDRKRAEDLAEWNMRLRELDEAKTAFFANASHELRTPVTLIAAPLDAIMAGRYGESIPRKAQVLSLMKRNADRLGRLADGLLDFLRLDEGKVRPSPGAFDLRELARPYAEEFAPLAEARGLALAFDEGKPAKALVDASLLETILLNILSNAMKFTEPGGRITIATGTKGDRSWIEIADTGPGIEATRIARLFERYAAAGEKSRSDYSGFGIGLPLSQGLARLMGGSIEVESAVGEGSVFRIILPAHVGAVEASPRPSRRRVADYGAAPSEAPEGGKGRAGCQGPAILVVDDDRDMAAFLADSLSRRFRVGRAHSGEEALGALSDGPLPQAIVADVMMPGMDGFELRRRVARLDRCSGIPFIFLSAKSDRASRLEGLEAGAVDYVAKPFSLDELEAKLDSLIAARMAEKDRIERKISSALREESAPCPDGGSEDWEAAAARLGLARREIELVRLIRSGQSDKEIAASLEVSPRTVSSRVSALLRKTGAKNRAGLAAAIEAAIGAARGQPLQ